MKLWIGKEREGKFKGVETLFVGSKTITFEKIEKTISDNPTICQIYFGAGKCTPINQDVLNNVKIDIPIL